MINKLLFWQDKNTLNLLKTSLENSNASITTTDTVFGLLAMVSESGFKRLNEIKKRSEKPYIILINSIEKNSKNHRYPVIPSTILDCTSENIKVIREGIFPVSELENIYGEKFIK